MKADKARRILVTGGTSGIGQAAATRLSVTDAVWVLGSTEQSARAAGTEMGARGWSGADVADRESVDTAIESALAGLGGLDAVFINAGIDGQALPAAELTIEGFRRVLEVNVIGAFNVAQACLPYLSRPGTILFNASVNALRAESHFLDYNASKAAVVSMAQTMALELAAEGITVLSLAPGYFPSRMTSPYLDDPQIREELLQLIPARRFGSLDEIAEVVDFMLSPAARFMNGAVITIDGGRSI